jgi:hypothetical protein
MRLCHMVRCSMLWLLLVSFIISCRGWPSNTCRHTHTHTCLGTMYKFVFINTCVSCVKAHDCNSRHQHSSVCGDRAAVVLSWRLQKLPDICQEPKANARLSYCHIVRLSYYTSCVCCKEGKAQRCAGCLLTCTMSNLRRGMLRRNVE